MSLFMTQDEHDDLPEWPNTPSGRAESVATTIAVEIAPDLAPLVLILTHDAAVSDPARRHVEHPRIVHALARLAPVLDPLLACAVAASQESGSIPSPTTGLDGSAILHTMLHAVSDILPTHRDHPVTVMPDEEYGSCRLDHRITATSDNDDESEPPWGGPHPITDGVVERGHRIDPEYALRDARRAAAALHATLP